MFDELLSQVFIEKSELKELFPKKALLCHPKYFDISYEINPWMNKKIKANNSKALLQWNMLHHLLLKLGIWVEYINPELNLPDMCFTANGGLTKTVNSTFKKAVIPNFKFPERQKESVFFKEWFFKRGYEILIPSNGFFEGEGDALFINDTLICGYGFRSDKAVYEEICNFLDVKDALNVELCNPYFYHLDTCFAPISDTKAIIYEGAFTAESLNLLRSRFELINIKEDEAKRFACNLVRIQNQIIIPSQCPDTTKKLEDLGYSVYSIELDEFLKAGGAAKCLTLFLN